MSRLSAAVRKKLPGSVFAGPDRSYPINDLAHAANAKARAKQQYDAGNLTAEEYAHILARANAFQRLHAALRGR